jgi:hypothetical protein
MGAESLCTAGGLMNAFHDEGVQGLGAAASHDVAALCMIFAFASLSQLCPKEAGAWRSAR